MAHVEPSRVVVAAVDDLFFSTKIESAAAGLGIRLIEARDALQLEAALAETTPDLVILDLNSRTCEPLQAIRRIRAEPRFRATRLLGFLSHVQKKLHQEALAAGCDAVVPRSRFSADLIGILQSGR